MNETPNNEKPRVMTRRRFLGLAALSTCGVATFLILRRQRTSRITLDTINDSLKLSAGIPKSSPQSNTTSLFYSTEPVEGIPQAWVDAKGSDILRYANFIQDLGLKNITPHDVIYPHFKTRGRTSNSIPPRRMWKDIVPTLRIIDLMATHMKAKAITFISIYRSQEYNRAVRGRSQSQHLANRAVRVKLKGIEPSIVARVARKFRKAGHFTGGVGDYQKYTHIDTRGHNSDW